MGESSRVLALDVNQPHKAIYMYTEQTKKVLSYWSLSSRLLLQWQNVFGPTSSTVGPRTAVRWPTAAVLAPKTFAYWVKPLLPCEWKRQ